MNKWGKIIVDRIDNNEPRHYPLDDKERNTTKFPKKKSEWACIKTIRNIKKKKKKCI